MDCSCSDEAEMTKWLSWVRFHKGQGLSQGLRDFAVYRIVKASKAN